MQAKYVAEMMDEVDSIKIAWHVGAPEGDLLTEESYDFVDAQDFKEKSPAGWNHLVHSMTGDIVVWKNGKFDKMPAWDSGEYIDFPYGRVPVFYVGHSEPHTLPRYIKIKDFCACLGGNRFHRELREEARGHLIQSIHRLIQEHHFGKHLKNGKIKEYGKVKQQLSKVPLMARKFASQIVTCAPFMIKGFTHLLDKP